MWALIIAGILVLAVAACLCYLVRPTAAIHKTKVNKLSKNNCILVVCVVAVTVLCNILPMGLAPHWNGEIPGHRNQYEQMAEAILDGHLYFDYEVDPKLEAMENPYDPDAREALGVSVKWDHAYYDGHYYMYFGIVPVFLVFLPFRILTGMSLTTFHATQIFVAAFIVGLFMLFKKLAELFFKDLSLSVYLFLSTAFSFMSVWYCVAAPALYCTAIAAALCLEVWSLYFFVRAVWEDNSDKKAILLAFFGALFGALTFGCRPPIALANVLVIPMLVVFLKKRKFSIKLLGQLVLAALPYVVVAVLLMVYNYVRFDDPFEFGQAYQLTVADQSAYGSILEHLSISKTIKSLYDFAFKYSSTLISCGLFILFPILFYSVIGIENTGVRASMKTYKLRGFVSALIISVVLIITIDVLWSPYMIPRYVMDFTWIMGILAFIIIGLYYKEKKNKGRFSFFICLLSMLTVIVSVMLLLYPHDLNFTHYYDISIKSLIDGTSKIGELLS